MIWKDLPRYPRGSLQRAQRRHREMWVVWRLAGVTRSQDNMPSHIGRVLDISAKQRGRPALVTAEAAFIFGEDYPNDPAYRSLYTFPLCFALQICFLESGETPPRPRLLRRPGFTPKGPSKRIKIAKTQSYRAV